MSSDRAGTNNKRAQSTASALGTLFKRLLKRSADKLDSCDLQYRTVLSSTFDSIIFLNDEAEMIELNEAATQAFGSPARTLGGRSFDSLIARILSDLPGGASSIKQLLAESPDTRHGPIQIVAIGPDDSRFPAEMNIVPTRYGDNSSFSIFLRELTEQVKARKALRRSQHNYQQLFEQMPIGVFRTLPDGTPLMINPALWQMLGYSAEDLKEANPNVRYMYLRPEQRDEFVKMLLKDGEVRNVELDLRRRDGTTVKTLANATVISNDPKHGVVLQGTLLDISDLAHTRDALKDSNEIFRTLADNSHDMVLIIDEDGRVVYCSPSGEAITGSPPQDIIGEHVFERTHPDDREHVREIVRRGFESPNHTESFTCRVMHSDGHAVYVESVGRAFLDSNNKMRAVINARDISDRQRAAVQLQQAQKMQAVGQLTGGIAHDFNNLLTVIVGNLQLLRESMFDSRLCGQVDTALQACVRGGDLTRRLLALARRQPLEPKIVNVNDLLANMDSLLKRTLSKSMLISTDYTSEPWLAKVDPSQLESALLNLAINSRDATAGEGQLTIRTSNCSLDVDEWPGLSATDNGQFVCIEVSDNGSGMDDDVLKQAVDPYFTTKKDLGGSGLGLSMVYGFVQQSDGHMRIESEPGAGTRIEMFLPRSEEAESTETVSNAQLEIPFGGESILVVDDNDAVRNSAAALIQKLGYKVRQASCGSAALKMLKDESADLLFTDVMMPEMSGFDLAAEASAEIPDLNILLTTGYADESIFDSEQDRNCYEILYKPYNQIQLAKRIRSVLDT